MDTPTEDGPILLTLNTAVEILKNSRHFAQYNKLRELDGVNKLHFPNFVQIPSRKYDFNPGDFEPINRIFTDDRVVVEQYLYKPTNIMMAVKFVRVAFKINELDFKERCLNKWKQEIETCKELPLSPNLVTLYGFCIYGGYVLVCMEYMDISLSEFINKLRRRGLEPSNDSIGWIGVSIINAMNDLKQKKIMHRDIKPQNILINKNGEIKLCDFGVSRIMKESLATTATGTIKYWPPERFQLDSSGHPIKYNTKADVWSLGMTLAEIWDTYNPFINIESNDLASMQNYIINMSKNTAKNRLQQNSNMSSIVEAFILECLKNVEERPTVEKLRDTEFCQRYKTGTTKDIQALLENAKIWNNVFDVFKKKTMRSIKNY